MNVQVANASGNSQPSAGDGFAYALKVRHTERVAELARRIAAEEKLADRLALAASLAAQLHDVGKVGISPEILEKSERLTDGERRELQRIGEGGDDNDEDAAEIGTVEHKSIHSGR